MPTAQKNNLRPGKQFDSLILNEGCSKTGLGSGDTFYTVKNLKTWVQNKSHQVKNLAPKLKGAGIKDTVKFVDKIEMEYKRGAHKLEIEIVGRKAEVQKKLF